MIDLTATVANIVRKADTATVAKVAAAEVARGLSVFSSVERSAMIGALAKQQGDAKLSDAQRFARVFQDPSNVELRKWALLPADLEHIKKRETLLDDTIAKARSPGAAPALGGERVYPRLTGAVLPVNNPKASDAQRQQIINEKRTAAPFMSDEQLAAYADSMLEHLGELERRRA